MGKNVSIEMPITDLTKLFSCCNRGDRAESSHQLAILSDWEYFSKEQREELEPKDIELRIIEALYSSMPLDYKKRIALDLSDPKEKKEQVRDFLEFHFKKYEDISFIDGVRKLIYFQRGEDRPASIGKNFFPEPQIEFITKVIYEWCDEKEKDYKLNPDKYTRSLTLQDKLDNILNKFTAKWKEQHQEQFLIDLKSSYDNYDSKQMAKLALMIYECKSFCSDYLVFSKWREQFYIMMDCKSVNYKKNQLKESYVEIEEVYYYLKS